MGKKLVFQSISKVPPPLVHCPSPVGCFIWSPKSDFQRGYVLFGLVSKCFPLQKKCKDFWNPRLFVCVHFKQSFVSSVSLKLPFLKRELPFEGFGLVIPNQWWGGKMCIWGGIPTRERLFGFPKNPVFETRNIPLSKEKLGSHKKQAEKNYAQWY